MVCPPIRVNIRKAGRRVALGLVLVAGLAGCGTREFFSAPLEQRGHMVDAEQLQQVVVGTHTRADVQAILGSPTSTATFDENQWLYISGMTRLRPLRTLALEDQRVVVVRFDTAGVVREVRELDRDDGRDIQVVQRETPAPGTDRTVLQQLFGNLGRLAPGAPGGSSGAGGQGR